MADPHQPADLSRPDLEESTNVAEAHATLIESGAAQAREKRLEESGMEPVSLWVFLACAVVLLVGGAVMGAGGKLFRYDPMPQDYVRAEFDLGGAAAAQPAPLMDLLMKRGDKVAGVCKSCHGPSGAGDAKYPPLAGSEWVTGSSERLAMIILNGLTGKITVSGKTYEDAMPSQMPLDQVQLAAVMTYVRNSFGNSAGIVTPDQAANALEIYKQRAGGQVTADELNANHDRDLEGATMDPATIVDPGTLQPVDGAASGE